MSDLPKGSNQRMTNVFTVAIPINCWNGVDVGVAATTTTATVDMSLVIAVLVQRERKS